MPVVARLLPGDSDVDRVRATLADHLTLRAGRLRHTSTTFYDTFDGRLRADGLTLRHADGRLGLLARADGRQLAAAPAPYAKRLFGADLPEVLRERLSDVIEMRALLPVAEVDTRTLPVAVLNGDEKTVVRLALETHATRQTALHPRIEAVAVRGYDADLERVDGVLTETLALPEATTPLVDEAIAAAGGDPAGTSSKLKLELTPGIPANEAAAEVFARLLEVIRANLPGTLEDVDTEFLHDLRVAVRRTRSLQRQFKSIYPERLQHFRDEFKRIQAITGDLRDLDVYLLDFPALQASLPEGLQADLDPLRAVLETRRARALTATRRGLRARRTQDALDQWAAFTREAQTADRKVEELAADRIARVYRKMVKMGRAIDDDSPPSDLHELRKVGKELRYLLEFFGSLFSPDVVKPFIKTLKGLQDQLGRFQDREVQSATLRELGPEVGKPATLMAMGVLVDRYLREETAARAEFAERFAVFAAKEQRALVREHFGP
jgi:CHAD domain-containing protein